MKKGHTTLADLATQAGVSISTASRALNDNPNVNARTKQLVWKIARELDYPFRQHMPAGPIGAEATIAVVVPRPQGRSVRLSDPFFLELFAAVGDAARERGCDILLSHLSPSNFDELERVMQTSRAEGLIFLGQSTLHTAFNRMAQSEQRFVVWGGELPEQRYCSVGGDNPRGGRRATLHLVRLGRRQIVFLGDTEAPEVMQRYRGYAEALEESGLGLSTERLVPAHFEVASAEGAIDALMTRGVPFDGVVAASDLIAIGAMRALERAGRRVPQDVSVVGFDNVPFARYSRPALSTISQDTHSAGRLLVSKLLDSGPGGMPRSERVPTDLIIRESCGG
jgi:DNA-binding LacI/PurR family transcriptional regulator